MFSWLGIAAVDEIACGNLRSSSCLHLIGAFLGRLLIVVILLILTTVSQFVVFIDID